MSLSLGRRLPATKVVQCVAIACAFVGTLAQDRALGQNSAIGMAAASRGEAYLGQPPPDCGGFVRKVFLWPTPLIWMPSGQVQTWGDQLAQHTKEWIELPNDWTTELQPGDICTIGHSGSTDPAAGHTWMAGFYNKQVDMLQASYPNRYAWRTMPAPTLPYVDPYGRYPVRFWRPVSRLPDGLYRASNEATVFLVRGGFRRTIPSAACFEDWHLSWNQIITVAPAALYGRTVAGLPITHLVRMPSTATVYWIVEDTNSTPYSGSFVARPIASAAVFDRMHFNWSDIQTVNYVPTDRYPSALVLKQVEPRLVIKDGPFVNPLGGSWFTGGYRVRNLSDASGTGFGITIRAWRTDGRWLDFPWLSVSGLNRMELDGVAHWSSRTVPSGRYGYAAVYSFWLLQDGQWHSVQSVAHIDGEYPYPDNPGWGTFRSP